MTLYKKKIDMHEWAFIGAIFYEYDEIIEIQNVNYLILNKRGLALYFYLRP